MNKNQPPSRSKPFCALTCAAVWLAACLHPGLNARAACSIDFEDRAVGTAITNQYPGVTFSVVPQTCGGNPMLFMRISQPAAGTSSGTNCIKIDTGCPDFSSDFLRMVFALPQSRVSFTLGDSTYNYYIRVYTVASGGTPVTTIVDTASGVHRLVVVTGSNIRRIEVESVTGGLFEAIDDLTFDADLTPPIAEITSPAFGACFCGASVPVFGRECEDDGVYGADVLEYMPVNGTNWTRVDGYTIPVCTPNSLLYTWPVAAVPDGTYFLKITVTNECGLSSSDLTVVNLHRTIDAAVIRSPGNGFIVGGKVCIDGSAYDQCFSYYLLEKKPVVGGSFLPVDSAHPTFTSQIQNDPLTDPTNRWNTAEGTTPDGDYLVRLTAYDTCGVSASQQIAVTVDNTAPAAVITEPAECSKRNGLINVYGTASDAHLASWALQYFSRNSESWVTISSGISPVVNGLLGNWDTTGLPDCAYALRLVVTDQSKVNLDCSGTYNSNQRIFQVSLDIVSDPLAQDTDADGMPDAWETAHGFDPNDPADAVQDADHDGKSNLEEYYAGTDPHDPASLLRITAIAREANDTRVTWTTAGSHHYLLEGGTDLSTGFPSTLSPLISVPPGGAATTNFLHTNGATLPQRFYRVRLAP